MKKLVEVEYHFCDECESQGLVRACLRCGKDLCWECAKSLGVEYSQGVSFYSHDGFYCRECDKLLTDSQDDELHNAYRAIAILKTKVNTFYENFDTESKTAELHLKTLLGK